MGVGGTDIYEYNLEVNSISTRQLLEKMEVYEFKKYKIFHRYLCQELHFALVYHDSELFSRILSDIGLFTPNSVFQELIQYVAPRTIIKQVFDHKKKNDAFIDDLQSSLLNQQVTLSEVKYILEDFGNGLLPYDIVNVQMLLNRSCQKKDMTASEDFHIYHPIINIWSNYKPLNAFADEIIGLASYCGEFTLLCDLLDELQNHGISFNFDPEHNITHEKIMSNLKNHGIAGKCFHDEQLGFSGCHSNPEVYEYIKQKLLSL